MRNFLAGLVTATVLLVGGYAVLVQQYDAWSAADLDRNVQEFNSTSTLESCMDEVDGVWLPWLRSEAKDMCTEAIRED